MTPLPLEGGSLRTSLRSSREGGEEVQEAARAWGWNSMQRAHPRGSFQTHPSCGMFQAPCHPFDHNGTNYLHPYYPWQAHYF